MLRNGSDGGIFFGLHWWKNLVTVSMQLSEKRDKSLFGAVCRDKSRRKLNVL